MNAGSLHNLLDLPEEIVETIVSYFGYNETSEARVVCKLFNKYCQQRLNRGFSKVDKLHNHIQKEVKNKLPRRESERRNHPLARHVDILSAIETRLSLLGMSYVKYIDMGLCCFIPGKVLDELINILHILQKYDTQPPRSHEFLQELRDISSMAMEHFDEKIVPTLKAKMSSTMLPYPFVSDANCSCPGDTPSTSTSTVSLFNFSSPLMRTPNLRSEVVKLSTQVRSQTTAMQQWRKEVNDSKLGSLGQQRKFSEQEKTIIRQGQTINELEKKVNDLNQKFVDMSAELLKLKEVQERGDNSKPSCSYCHNEELSKVDNVHNKVLKKADDIDKGVNTRSKGMKRKVTASTAGRVKKTRH